MSLINDDECALIQKKCPIFKGVPDNILAEFVGLADVVTYPANTFISQIGDYAPDPLIVLSGLIRVSACSESGKRITFLLVSQGEVYNMVGPYLDRPRILEATAIQKTRCLHFKGRVFMDFIANHQLLVNNVFKAIGGALDIANTRILDMMDKKVDKRIMRVLSSLHDKFGSPLLFTSTEVSELAGTTPESTLRVMAVLREKGIVETSRGKIWIKQPDLLLDTEFGHIFLSSTQAAHEGSGK